MEDDQSYHVNYKNIVNEKSLLAMTRLLAIDLTKNPYMTIGDFLKNVSDGDLEELIKIVDDNEEHPHFEDLMLISMMLASAEGTEGNTLESVTSNLNMFTTFIVCESLNRKKLVKVFHENMSFGEDMKNKIIAKPL